MYLMKTFERKKPHTPFIYLGHSQIIVIDIKYIMTEVPNENKCKGIQNNVGD